MKDHQWDLRNKCLDFVSVCVLTRDEPALTWLLQRCVLALRELVPPEMIVKRVQDVLPGRGER